MFLAGVYGRYAVEVEGEERPVMLWPESLMAVEGGLNADRSVYLLSALQIEAAWAAAQQVVISGATGNNAVFVNGRFEQVEREQVYRKVGELGRWLFSAEDGRWYVGSTAGKDARKTNPAGFAHSVASAGGMPPPAGAGRWKVGDGPPGRWVEQTLEVKVLSAAQAAFEPEPEHPTSHPALFGMLDAKAEMEGNAAQMESRGHPLPLLLHVLFLTTEFREMVLEWDGSVALSHPPPRESVVHQLQALFKSVQTGTPKTINGADLLSCSYLEIWNNNTAVKVLLEDGRRAADLTELWPNLLAALESTLPDAARLFGFRTLTTCECSRCNSIMYDGSADYPFEFRQLDVFAGDTSTTLDSLLTSRFSEHGTLIT